MTDHFDDPQVQVEMAISDLAGSLQRLEELRLRNDTADFVIAERFRISSLMHQLKAFTGDLESAAWPKKGAAE